MTLHRNPFSDTTSFAVGCDMVAAARKHKKWAAVARCTVAWARYHSVPPMSKFWVVAVCASMAMAVAATSGPLSPADYMGAREAAAVYAATGKLTPPREPPTGPAYEFDGGLCFGGSIITVGFPGPIVVSGDVHIAFGDGCDTQAARDVPSPSEADFLRTAGVQISDELDFYGRCVLGAETT